jgi:hypothetical protein
MYTRIYTLNLRNCTHYQPHPFPQVPLDRYEVVWRDEIHTGDEHFTFRGSDEHHACTAPLEMLALLEDARFREGGLHYFAGDPLFWTLIANWHVHGSALPFPGPCGDTCSIPSKDKWREVQALCDGWFRGASIDLFNVRCMFVDTPIGCHDSVCPFDGHKGRGALAPIPNLW